VLDRRLQDESTNFNTSVSLCGCAPDVWNSTLGLPLECYSYLYTLCSIDAAREWCTGFPESVLTTAGVASSTVRSGSSVPTLAVRKVLEEAGAECGRPFMKLESFEKVFGESLLPVHMWNVDDCTTWMYMIGLKTFGLSAGMEAKWYTERIYGAAWMRIGVDTYVSWGIPFGIAAGIVDQVQYYVKSFSDAPSLDNQGLLPGDRAVIVYPHVSLERLIEVRAPEYWQAEFSISLSWRDARIYSNCTAHVKEASIENTRDPCDIFWQPQVFYPEALLGDEEPQTVVDYGLTTLVGSNTDPNGAAQGVTESFGYISYKLRAKFSQVLDYERIPFDKHALRFTMRFTELLKASDPTESFVCFDADAATQVDIAPKDENALWKVDSFTSETQRVLSTPRVQLIGANLKNPLIAHHVHHDGPKKQSDGTVKKRDIGVDASGDDSICEVVFEIYLHRINTYHIINYILVEVLLVLLGWFTFFMDPLAIDSRLSISLTLVLAINVFQIVLVENMPETGYLTDLHWYTFFNTVLLALIALQSIIVCEASKRETKRRELLKVLRNTVNDKRVIAALVKLQRYFRRVVLANKAKKRYSREPCRFTLKGNGSHAGRGKVGSSSQKTEQGSHTQYEASIVMSLSEVEQPKNVSHIVNGVLLNFDMRATLLHNNLFPRQGVRLFMKQKFRRFCQSMSSAIASHGDAVSAWVLFPIPFLLYSGSFIAGCGPFFFNSV